MATASPQWFAVPPRGEVPIAFLPVRIETRFGKASDGSSQLWVRVFPDDVHVNSFEPALTSAESAARTTFLATPDAAAWTRLAQQFGPARAAWIASPSAGSSGSKASDWTQPATTALLPDRFIVCAYDDEGNVMRVAGAEIADGLTLGPSPGGGDPATDPGLRWMRDFDHAVSAGLGIRIPLTPVLAGNGFARILVLGVKTRVDPTTSATRFGATLDAHHYTDGIELLPIGTPTNNSDGVKSGYNSSDPAYATSFAVERGLPMTPSADGRGDGDRLARALGIDAVHFAHIGGAGGRHDDAPAAMNTVLWPATWEYYLENLVNGAVPDPAITIPAARAFFLAWVRARGPWPTLRVGRQPYGILPVIWTGAYQPRDGDVLTARLFALLESLRPIWRTAASQLPRVGLGSDPDATLASVLGMSPCSTTYVGRSVLGPQFNEYYWLFLARTIDRAWWTRLGRLGTAGLGTLATTAAATRLGNATYLGSHFDLWSTIVAAPLTNASLTDNYLAIFGAMTLAQLRGAAPSGPNVPLLWVLARHAALRQYASSAYGLLGAAVSPVDQLEPEMIDIVWGVHTAGVWDHLAMAMPSGAGEVGTYLDQHKADGPAPFVAFWKALNAMAGLSTTDLDQVLRETLDLHSHRLDAWYTALATQRLDALRQQQGNALTLYLGAYGWVDNVRPQPAPVSWGYIHAPSIAHAASAAVLRSGYLTHRESGSSAAAIELSSARVRLALTLLDGVRSGQALGALIGYQFERALHTHSLDLFIQAFRKVAPMEGVTGDHTVDGLLLLQRRHRIPWGLGPWPPSVDNPHLVGWPKVGDPTQVALVAELNRLADTVDAISDLMLAETVHQLVGGNALRAGATVDAIGRGDTPPPVLDITRTPRRGGAITHRLLALLGSGSPSGWATTPRGQAEPRLDALAAGFLGLPTRVAASAQIIGPDESVVATIAMTLSDLGVGPLDVLAMSPSEVEARLTRLAWSRRPATTPAGSTVTLVLTRDPTWSTDRLSISEFMTAAASCRALIAGARAATAADFTSPDQTVDPAMDTAELKTRADQAATALDATRTQFAAGTPTDVALLSAAQFGVINAIPGIDPSAWPGQAQQARDELDTRSARLKKLDDGFTRNGAAATALRDHDIARLQIIFGAGFRVVACLTSAFAGTLAPLFSASGALLGTRPLEPITWLTRVARVRAGVARLAEAMLHAEALNSSAPLMPVVAQIPRVPNDLWAGLPLPPGAQPADRLSLVAVGATSGATGALVIDEWLETIPNRVETTGVAFHADDPTATAPQAILLAVKPDTSPEWTLPSVEGTLLDAIEMTHLRAVDPDTLGDVGHFLPALLFAINQGSGVPDTISSDLTRAAPPDPISPLPPVTTTDPPILTRGS
jgi:hypothetical protein